MQFCTGVTAVEETIYYQEEYNNGYNYDVANGYNYNVPTKHYSMMYTKTKKILTIGPKHFKVEVCNGDEDDDETGEEGEDVHTEDDKN